MTTSDSVSAGFTSLLQTALGRLFGLAAKLSPPYLVHPVHGHVATRLTEFWPREPRTPPPPRLLSPLGLRRFLLGADESSEVLGKFGLLGLPVGPLQAQWSVDGARIGALAVRIADVSAAPATTVTVSTASVTAAWRLNPFTSDAASIATASQVLADLLTAALRARADDAEFRTAAAGRPLEEAITAGRAYLGALAVDWLTVVCGLVRVRTAQQSAPGAGNATADARQIIDAYNARKPTTPADPFHTYLSETFLRSHPCTRAITDDDPAPEGRPLVDVLRAAIHHTDAGHPVREDGVPGATTRPATGAPSPGSRVLEEALRLADRISVYTSDPARRWDENSADCSSFVQRALFAAGSAVFDPGPDHAGAWTSFQYATRDDVFATVPLAAARPGDVLVQGGYRTVDGTTTWCGHCGLCTRAAQPSPGLLEGVSLDAAGPSRGGLWGAEPPRGSYPFGANLLVRRPLPPRTTVPGVPFGDFVADNPSVTADNAARHFAEFSPERVGWQDDAPPGGARVALDAVGLGLRYTVRRGRTPHLQAPTQGIMVCGPASTRTPPVRRLTMYLSDEDHLRLISGDPWDEDTFDVVNARFVYELSPALFERLAAALRGHHTTGRLRPVFAIGVEGPRGTETINDRVPFDLDTAEQVDAWTRGSTAVLWRFADGVDSPDVPLLQMRQDEEVVLYAEVLGRQPEAVESVWYRVDAGFVLDRLRRDRREDGLDAEYDLLTGGFRAGKVASGGPVDSRTDLVAVWGGSAQTLVLQPRLAVPASLFTFATCDEIHLFAPAIAAGVPVAVRSAAPTLGRGTLTGLCAKYGIPQQFTADAADEFPATDYPAQVVARERPPDRRQDFYDELAPLITYGPSGWKTGSLAGTGSRRTLIPQADPASRPEHPRWTARRTMLLRRLYPLQYSVRLGDTPEFALTQDERDCIRQEYVFHLRFTDAYFQTYTDVWKPAAINQYVFPNTTTPPHKTVTLPGGTRLPALGRNGVINVPYRTELRKGRGTAYHYTRLVPAADALISEAREAAERHAEAVLAVVQAAQDGTALPRTDLPDHAVDVVLRIARLLSASWTAPLERFLAEQLAAHHPIDRFAVRGAGGRLSLRPYGLTLSSGWRPPEHNETVSKTPSSNHQLGEAMDLQPQGAGSAATRNPLALMCLHLAAQDHFSADPPRLRECLLENGADEYFFGLYDRDRSAWTLIENPSAGAAGQYVLRDVAGEEMTLSDVSSYDGERITERTPLDVRVPRLVRAEFDKGASASRPWPRPTYLDTYVFALCQASHVHHTWAL